MTINRRQHFLNVFHHVSPHIFFSVVFSVQEFCKLHPPPHQNQLFLFSFKHMTRTESGVAKMKLTIREDQGGFDNISAT